MALRCRDSLSLPFSASASDSLWFRDGAKECGRQTRRDQRDQLSQQVKSRLGGRWEETREREADPREPTFRPGLDNLCCSPSGSPAPAFVQGLRLPWLTCTFSYFLVLLSFPPARQIISAQLVLHVTQTSSGPANVTLHRVREAWIEGSDNADGAEGAGTTATSGATWLFAGFPGLLWSARGGVFDATPSSGAVAGAFLRLTGRDRGKPCRGVVTCFCRL